jgi:hypothetical protein
VKSPFVIRGWLGFGIYLLIGFATPILLGLSFNKVIAKSTIVDVDRFDPNTYPAIDVIHNPPLLAEFDSKVKLEFSFVCGYVVKTGLCCQPDATLFVAYGQDRFAPISLTLENQDSLRVLSADLPASNENGQVLQYYIQVNDRQSGLNIRYPTVGAIDLFVTDKFISVELPSPPPVDAGELILALPWGNGPEEVGLREREGYPAREGPIAMDVADDGRIALLDHVNERVLIYNPAQKRSSIILLPFSLHSQGNIKFDRNGQVAVFDPVGEPIGQSTVNIPQLYLFQSDGHLSVVAPVFARIPAWLTEDLEIVDLSYSKLVVSINSSGGVNSREIQQQKQPAKLLVKYMPDTVYIARFADVAKGIAFEVHSVFPLGAITHFENTPQGYLAVFEADQFSAVWFDSSGNVLQVTTLPRDDYSEINSLGRIATDSKGSLYILQSISNGIEVRYVNSP